MSIAAAILADNPVLYWKLDDPTGPAASDSSGHGATGLYLGNFSLQTPGPEVGTFGALFGVGGGVRTLADTPRKVLPWSLDMWVAPAAAQTNGANIICNGNSMTTGLGLAWGTFGVTGQPVHLERGGLAAGGDVGPMNFIAWHHVAVTMSAASLFTEYVDGVSRGVAPALPFNPPGAGDGFLVGSFVNPQQGLYSAAHAALYSTELTGAQVLAHFNGNTTAELPSGGGVITQASTNQLLLLLNEILAAVRKTF